MKWIFYIIAFVLLIDAFAYSLINPWLLTLALPGFLLLVFFLIRGRNVRHDDEAGWVIGKGTDITNPDKLRDVPKVVLPNKTLALGVLGIGSPGAGKTESLLVGALNFYTSQNLGWAAFDGKGQLDVYQKTVASGAVPDAFFSSELPNSHTMNLIEGIPEDVVDRLSKVLIGNTASTSFYSDEQRSVLLSVVPMLLGLGLRVNLRDLYVLLSNEEAGYEVLMLAKEMGVDEATYRMAKSWFDGDFGNRISTIKGLLNRLFVFVSGPAADRINDYYPDIVLSDVVSSGKRVFFHFPESRFTKDVAIMVIESLASIAKRRQQGDLEKVALFPLVFDDWGALFHAGFKPFSARCRSAKLPLSFFFQSRAQLQDVSPTFETEIDDAIATKIMMRINGQDTGELASKMMGTFDTYEVSTSQLGERDGTSVSAREVPRLRSNEFKALEAGEAFVSTLMRQGGYTFNALLRIRFPRVDVDGWRSVQLPEIKHQDVLFDSDEVLNLWGRYMTPELLKAAREAAEEEVAA